MGKINRARGTDRSRNPPRTEPIGTDFTPPSSLVLPAARGTLIRPPNGDTHGESYE
jgi:hypothetical protein